jgi:DTW domain-containing protein YfiP
MALQNDELSSHRTRTNRLPEPVSTATAATAVLDPIDSAEVPQA